MLMFFLVQGEPECISFLRPRIVALHFTAVYDFPNRSASFRVSVVEKDRLSSSICLSVQVANGILKRFCFTVRALVIHAQVVVLAAYLAANPDLVVEDDCSIFGDDE